MESFTIFNFFSHGWSHYLTQLQLSATRLCKMTGYDLQLHLRYRKSIWNKETEIRYCSWTKMFSRYPWVAQVLTMRMSQVFHGKIIYVYRKRVSGVDKVVNLKDFSRPNKKNQVLFNRTLTESKDFSKQLLKFKTFSRLYEPRYQRIPYQNNQANSALSPGLLGCNPFSW